MQSIAAFEFAVGTPRRPSRAWAAVGTLAVHLIAVATVLALAAVHSASQPITTDERHASPIVPDHIVFLAPTLPSIGGGGGGGGGNGQSGPIRRAEAPGHDRMTLRIAKRVEASDRIVDAEPRLPALVLDAKPLASGFVDRLGLPASGALEGTSLGPGTGGGVGTGTGTGIGDGRGPGLGTGTGGGTGGGPYRPGGPVTAPQIIFQVRPAYTAAALQERIQGAVILELVVTETGKPDEIRVVRSLPHGLDDEAIKAVAQWKFAPGRLSGTPVPVLVRVILDFSIR